MTGPRNAPRVVGLKSNLGTGHSFQTAKGTRPHTGCHLCAMRASEVTHAGDNLRRIARRLAKKSEPSSADLAALAKAKAELANHKRIQAEHHAECEHYRTTASP